MATQATTWEVFPEESGSLGVPRESMPQIRSEHRGALVQFLRGRGIAHSQEMIAPGTLKPSQDVYSPEKVEAARNFDGLQRPILVSADDHVLDGHHQWLSGMDAPDEPVRAIRFDAPIKSLLLEAARFPSSGVDESSAQDSPQQGESSQPSPVMDEHEFAARVRAKYPGEYDALDDADLTRRVVQKYPEYQSQVRLSPPAPSFWNSPAPTAEKVSAPSFWGEPQMDAQIFAGKIRSQYPGEYDHLDDVDLSRRVLAKYPEYRPLVRLPNSALKPSVKSSVREDVDFDKEDFSGTQLYPDASPETVTLDVGQAIAKYFHDRARPALPEMPKGYGQELGQPVQVKVRVPKGRYPTTDEVDNAVMNAMGGDTYVRAARQYRKQAGEPLGQAGFDVASAFQRGEAGYVEDGKGGGYYLFNVQPKQRLIRALNTYLQTGSVEKVREVDRQIAEADERFQREYQEAKQKAEDERGVLDAVGTGLDEVAAKGGQLVHNVGALGKGAYTRAVYGRDSAELNKLVEDDRRAQELVDASESAVPPEKTTAGKIARGVTEMAGDVATKGWMGPAFPAGVFAENLHRGPMEATERAAPTVPMVMAGQVVGKLTEGMSPAARQVLTRGAMGGASAGAAALAGERDPVNLGLATTMGLLMPVGKAEESGPVPESRATLEAQLSSARDPNSPRVAVFYPKSSEEPARPSGFARVETPDGVLHVNVGKAKEMGLNGGRAIKSYVAENGITPLIGKVADVSDTSQGVALRTEDAQGRELSTSIVTSPEAARAQAAVDRQQFPQAANQELGSAQEMAARRVTERFTHPVLGELTATPDQSGVRDGFVRVTDESGFSPFIVRRPDSNGGGNVRSVDESPPDAARTPLRQTAIATYKAGLLGLKTHLRNIGSTASFQALEEFSRLPSAITDMATSLFTGRRSVSGPSLRAVGRSSLKAATEGISEAREILKRGATADQLDRYGAPASELNSGSRILDAYVNTHFRLLAAEDQVFRTYALRRSLEDQARIAAINQVRQGTIPRSEVKAVAARLVERPTPDMQARAIADAEVATFNNQNVVSRAYGSARNTMEETAGGKVVNTGLDVLLPFHRTPTNIIARTLEYTPAGAAKATIKAAVKAMRGEFTQSEQRAFSRLFGRAATGSTLILLGYTLGAKGLLTGAPGNDPRYSASDPTAPPFSIKIGGAWHKIAGFSPLGDLLSLGATVHQLSQDESGMGAAADAGMKLVGEQPMLRQSGELYNAATSPGTRGVKFAGRLAGGAIPTLVSDAASAIDDKERARGNSFWNQIAVRVPFLRESLPEAKGPTGQPIEHRRTDFIDPTMTRSVQDEKPQARSLRSVVDSVRSSPDYESQPEEARARTLRSVQSSAGEDIAAGLNEDAVLHNSRVNARVATLRSIVDAEESLTQAERDELVHAINMRFFYSRFKAGDRRKLSDVERVFAERSRDSLDDLVKRIEAMKRSN